MFCTETNCAILGFLSGVAGSHTISGKVLDIMIVWMTVGTLVEYIALVAKRIVLFDEGRA